LISAPWHVGSSGSSAMPDYSCTLEERLHHLEDAVTAGFQDIAARLGPSG
jgi:hypothetical protein